MRARAHTHTHKKKMDKSPHALVVPASGQSHANSCMLLARSLAALGFHVSFVYFSTEYAKLRAKEHLTASDAIVANGADPSFQHCNCAGSGSRSSSGTESPWESDAWERSIHIHVLQDGFGPEDINKIFFVTPTMKENLFNLILELRQQGTPLTCLISEPFAPWTLHVTERAGIPLISYLTCSAMGYVLAVDIDLLFSQGIFPEKGSPTQWKRETPLMLHHIPSLPPFSSELYPKEVRFADASDPFISLLNEVSVCGKHGERMLIHTISDLEPDAFHTLQEMGIPAYAVGPLLHHTKKQDTPVASSQAKENSDVLQPSDEKDCILWLNMQAESSVIYISFGTIVSFSAEEILELAFGLEASGNPFLWVIREDSCSGEELSLLLPDGFLDRINGKAMIISWAPQMDVLAHRAIGGFLTHCGWNSTFESLRAGVPILCCPYFAEQMSNMHYVCNVWGVGLELGRTYTGGVERRYVELGVKALMQEEEGMKARGKAKEVMQLAKKTCQKGGQSFSNLQKFYEDMKTLCSKLSCDLSS